MSSYVFNPGSGPIYVQAEATGPLQTTSFRLLLDTGATKSLIKRSALIYLGIDPDQSTRHVQMMSVTGVEIAPIVVLTRFSALGQHRFGFSIIAHTLPTSSGVDGLLGLDFLRNYVLTIDFPAALIDLA